MLPPKRTVVAIRELVPFQLNEPMHRTSILTPTAYDEAYPVPGLGGDEPVGNRPIARNGAYRKSPQIVGTALGRRRRAVEGSPGGFEVFKSLKDRNQAGDLQEVTHTSRQMKKLQE